MGLGAVMAALFALMRRSKISLIRLAWDWRISEFTGGRSPLGICRPGAKLQARPYLTVPQSGRARAPPDPCLAYSKKPVDSFLRMV